MTDIKDQILNDLTPTANRNILTTFLNGLRRQREVIIAGGREMAAAA